MTIDTKSWHYRWLRYAANSFGGDLGRYDDAQSLCQYFWWFWGYSIRFFFYVFLCTVLASAFLALLSLVPALLWSWFHNGSHDAMQALQVIAGIASIFATIAFIGWIFHMFAYHSDSGFLRVCREFFKARKKKFCPRLEYKR